MITGLERFRHGIFDELGVVQAIDVRGPEPGFLIHCETPTFSGQIAILKMEEDDNVFDLSFGSLDKMEWHETRRIVGVPGPRLARTLLDEVMLSQEG